jgi:hypothetical protein
MACLNTALLAGIAATVAFLPDPQHIWWLVLSVGANIVGISLALLGLVLATILIGVMHLPTAAFLRRWLGPAAIVASLCFGIALVAFEVFAGATFGRCSRARYELD